MYIVNDFEKLQPNEYNLRHALNLSNDEELIHESLIEKEFVNEDSIID